MLEVEQKSMKRRIKKSRDLRPLVEEMVEKWDSWPRELYFDIKHRILRGCHIDEMLFAKVTILSRSRTLYQSRTFHGIYTLHELFAAAIPDRNIELRICENVENEYQSEVSTSLRSSLRLLAEFGSVKTLDILEPLAFDNMPVHQVATIRNDMLNTSESAPEEVADLALQFDRISTSLKVKTYKELSRAVALIKRRNAEPDYRFIAWSTI